jgi:membrane protease YdiL (CAAX protease family)
MKTIVQQTDKPLSTGKIIGYSIACIGIFILIASICELLTGWINPGPLKIAVREVLLRMPLTVLALHYLAQRVIKTYDPSIMHGRITAINSLKWIAISFILPVSVWLFYYGFHFIELYRHTVLLSTADKVGLLIKWSSISIAAGVTEEILFRGHLFMIISSSCSKLKAMLITSLIFGLVHIAMLPAITAGDIVIVVFGGVVAGMMFSVIYLSTKTIWYTAIVHVVWDIFFIGKITTLATTQDGANNAILAFKLTSNNLLLTGSSFGMEAALPCLLIYLLVIAVLYRKAIQ